MSGKQRQTGHKTALMTERVMDRQANRQGQLEKGKGQQRHRP